LKILKILFAIVASILLLIGIGAVYLLIAFPKTTPPPQIHVEVTPQRIQHGEYLAKHVTGCVVCHANRASNYYGDPVIAGTEGKGGLFVTDGKSILNAPNITPYALSSWSDGEIARAVISGVNKGGDPLFPIMPYQLFSSLTQEDLFSIIAYVRSLPAIKNDVPRSKLAFPMNWIVRTIPHPATIRTDTPKNRGEYLTRIASCIECHTPVDDHHRPIPGMEFAGGQKFEHVVSANITPDPETGIGKWSRENFINTFKRFDTPEGRTIELAEGTPNTVMPWSAFSGMTEEDLGAIYDYLRTVKPVHHAVQRFPPPEVPKTQ
jgi:mono/diheme cytochrome c family protein